MGGALVVAAVAIWSLWPSRPEPIAQVTPSVSDEEVTSPPASVEQPAPSAPLPPPPRVLDTSLASVTIDKNEVCVGEQNVLRVHLRSSLRGARTFVDGELGSAHVYIPMNAQDAQVSPRVAVVTANGSHDIQAPTFKVKNCTPERTGQVRHRALMNATDVYEFMFIATSIGGKKFKPTVFHWDFGDGKKETSRTASVTHSYGMREQNLPISDMLIRLDMEDAEGNRLQLHDTLTLQNEAFNALQSGLVQIFSDSNPRFPEEDRQGNVIQKVTLWHVHNSPVRVAKVTIEESDDHKTRRRIVEAGEILSGTTLRPGQTIEFPVRLEKDSPYRVVRYQVHGKSDDGKIAGGGFSIQRPTARPTAEDHSPVDARTAMRIRMAQKILGKPFVSDGDMDRLEAQGAFRKLEARPD